MNRKKLLIPAALALVAVLAFWLWPEEPEEPAWDRRFMRASDGYDISGVVGTVTEINDSYYVVSFTEVPVEGKEEWKRMTFAPKPKIDVLLEGFWYRVPEEPVLLPPGSIPPSGFGWDIREPLSFSFRSLRKGLPPGHYRAVLAGTEVEFDVQ